MNEDEVLYKMYLVLTISNSFLGSFTGEMWTLHFECKGHHYTESLLSSNLIGLISYLVTCFV
jgi:hypothetical protein